MQRVHLFILLLCASLQPSIGLPDGYSHRAMADRELSVTLAIPCVSRHIQFLEGLFVDIVSQTLMPVEVVVALSDASVGEEATVSNSFHNAFALVPNSQRTTLPSLIILSTQEKRNHAENRNRAAAAATGEIIRMHPDRLAVVACGLATTGANAFLHSFVRATDDIQRHDPTAAWPSTASTSDTTSTARRTSPGKVSFRNLKYTCGDAPLVRGDSLHDVYNSLLEDQGPAEGALEEDGYGFARVVPLPVEISSTAWKFNPAHGHISIRRHTIDASPGVNKGCRSSDRGACFEQIDFPATTIWTPGSGTNGEGEDVLYTKAILQRNGRTNYSMAYSPRKLSLYLPTFIRRCVILEGDGSARMLFDCKFGEDGVTVHFSGLLNLPPCSQKNHVQGLSYTEIVAVPGLLEKYATWNPYLIEPDSSDDLTLGFACFPLERRAEFAPGIIYRNAKGSFAYKVN